MSNHSFAAMTQNSSSVLSKALGDPAVDQLARRLHIDLQDPATLNGLLAMTRQCVDGSSGGAVAPMGVLAPTSDHESSHYERDAILSYQEIAAMV
jgi:hypothetical protein